MIKSQNDDEVTLRLVTLGSQHHPQPEGQRGAGGVTWRNWSHRGPICWELDHRDDAVLLPTAGRTRGEKHPVFSLLLLQSLPLANSVRSQWTQLSVELYVVCGQPDRAAEQRTGRVKSG